MFNEIINSRGRGSYKWDTIVDDGIIERGAYPLSVADMEFKTPLEVRQAITDLLIRVSFVTQAVMKFTATVSVNFFFAVIILK